MDNALSLLPVNVSKALMALPVKISAKRNGFKPKILPIKMAA
jgi:hypothetical protein